MLQDIWLSNLSCSAEDTMSCTQAKIDFLVTQMKEAGSIRAKKMFGEYGIYCDEKIVA